LYTRVHRPMMTSMIIIIIRYATQKSRLRLPQHGITLKYVFFNFFIHTRYTSPVTRHNNYYRLTGKKQRHLLYNMRWEGGEADWEINTSMSKASWRRRLGHNHLARAPEYVYLRNKRHLRFFSNPSETRHDGATKKLSDHWNSFDKPNITTSSFRAPIIIIYH